MTIAQADILADRIRNAPHLYDSLPTLSEGVNVPNHTLGRDYSEFYPWFRNQMNLASNVYGVKGGFAEKTYSGDITDWDATSVGQTASGMATRYVTIDDIRMMAYVGIEYARAKLGGWRIRYGELGESATRYPSGSIVRLPDGMRYIHRKVKNENIGNVTPPPGIGYDYYYSLKFWTPMCRHSGFEVPQNGGFSLPDDFQFSTTSTSELIQIGTIDGNDDIVKFLPYQHKSSAPGATVLSSLVEQGGFQIILVPMDATTAEAPQINEEALGDYLIAYQQHVYPFYDYYFLKNGIYIYANTSTKQLDYSGRAGVKVQARYMIDGNGGMIPLKRGRMYGVFAKFDSAILSQKWANTGYKLVSYVRYGTRRVAPYMWRGDTSNIQWAT